MADLIFIDNFDSFTYNLVDQFRSLGHDVTIYRNQVSLTQLQQVIATKKHPVLILSPGPGKPSDAGNMPDFIQYFKGRIPMIGICLGHQAIVESYGGVVSGADDIVHGKISMMKHQAHQIFEGLPNPFAIARYHSLIASQIPRDLTVTAQVDNQAMAVIHEADKICGYQFHPESLMTTYGATLLENSIQWALN